MEVQPEHWRYGVPSEEQHRLRPLLKALERLRDRGLTAAVAMTAFHRRRVLPLMAWRRRLFEMTPDEPVDGIRMSAAPLSDEEVLRRVNKAVEGRQKIGGLSPFPMRPTPGYLSLVSRVRLQPPRPPCSSPWPEPLFAFVVFCRG